MPVTPEFPNPSRITTNGIELEVFEAGQGRGGDPVVLCHGWPEVAWSWRHQIPALVDAGYHVIAPNQRGFGHSARPDDVAAYDIAHLSGDLIGLLDHYGYQDATFIGHDWGALAVWGLALLHPHRVRQIIALSAPYPERGDTPWVELMERLRGPNHYVVHFNRHPGVADAVLQANTARFLGNLLRRRTKRWMPGPGNPMINIALSESPRGDPLLSAEELAVTVAAFKASGFTASINWYRNFNRNWHLLADVDPILRHRALMIYGKRDHVPRAAKLAHFVPNVEVTEVDAGHWIQQEAPEDVTQVILEWLGP